MSIPKPSNAPHASESIVHIPLDELHPPDFQPFQLKDDDSMLKLAENIKENGVLVPGIIRSRHAGGYELVVGNRRKRACELAGESTMPTIIREMDDDTAAIV
ncbi:MAG: ParB/RepB/Spo0J family partition protein [Defluviitaleaceae bacterium]|nr:ParB/RepB/Spo0J family partition protein [Defluviitaleaceae bacterium]